MALQYKFIELSVVTDETLEAAVNQWVARGWQLDAIRFAMSEASRRPAMAFVSFVRDEVTSDAHPRDATPERAGTSPGCEEET
jgi:hypothetical protein